MPGKILGIDISEHDISAVQVISGLKGYQVISCFSTPVTDNNLEKALEELSGRSDLKSDRYLLAIPASNISFRNMSTPFKDAKKIRQTLPFEMEPMVPFPVDESIIDYIHTDGSNPLPILTSAVNKTVIENYIEQLKGAGIDPDIIDVRPVPVVTWLLEQGKTPANGIYLDLEPGHPCVVIFQNKKIVLIRELPCSFTEKAADINPEENTQSFSEPIENVIYTICKEADRTIYSFNFRMENSFTIERVFFGGRLSDYKDASEILNNFYEAPAEKVNISRDSRLKMDADFSGEYKPALMENALAVSIRESKKGIGFNFRRGEFAVKRSFLGPGKDIKRVAILISIFLVLMFTNIGADFYYVYKKHAMVEKQFNKEFDKRLPGEKGIKGTKLRILTVQQKLKELNNPSDQVSDGVTSDQKVLDIWREISKRVNEGYDFDVNVLTVRNNQVTISATTDNYATVDKIRNALKGSSLFKKVDTSNIGQAKDRIKFDLKLVVAG